MPNLIRTLALAGVTAFLALPSAAAPNLAAAYAPGVTAHDAGDPAKLAEMLARYDAMAPGAARDRYALEIDHFAGQRYATVSRLFWYQNLDQAKAAAAQQHRPILHLRMLGKLDEDLSCANSRFFRTTLYANAEISKFLRENFVLYWSSERPVPRVTIDFGDGRKLERTVTGNSAHYVLDAQGRVLDVLPGLYAPFVFRAELAKSLALATKVRKLDDAALVAAVVKFHEQQLQSDNQRYAATIGTSYVRRPGRLIGASDIGEAAVTRAQLATMSKARVEVVELRQIGIDAGSVDAIDVAEWATVGQKVWNIGLAPAKPASRVDEAPPPVLLDAQSIALIDKLRAGNPAPKKLDALVARLEQAILADTALNQFRLRSQIRSQLIYGRDLAWQPLNDLVYANVFHTPKADAWLGLLDGTDFTGLPADGVVMP